MSGINLIADERARQIQDEDWTPAHDKEHNDSELIWAAAAYLLSGEMSIAGKDVGPLFWPFEQTTFKLGDKIRNLTKAAALIAAEIDRLS